MSASASTFRLFLRPSWLNILLSRLLFNPYQWVFLNLIKFVRRLVWQLIRTRYDSSLIKFENATLKVVYMFKACKSGLVPLVQHLQVDTCLGHVSFICFIRVFHAHERRAFVNWLRWLLIHELLLDSLIGR